MSAQPRQAAWRLRASLAPAVVRDRSRSPVYDRLKERLLTQPPLPGRALEVRPLADELGVSTTPVREALTRLAAERLLVASRHRGFFVELPSGQDIIALYCTNQAVLGAALERWSLQIRDACDPLRVAPPGSDAQALARSTGEVFLQIATRPGFGEFRHIVSNISDRLHRVRVVECTLIGGVREELAQLSAAVEQRRRDDLRALLRRYHERREVLVASLCQQLVIESYSPVRAGSVQSDPGSSRNFCTA